MERLAQLNGKANFAAVTRVTHSKLASIKSNLDKFTSDCFTNHQEDLPVLNISAVRRCCLLQQVTYVPRALAVRPQVWLNQSRL